jgi:hypothetical protein
MKNLLLILSLGLIIISCKKEVDSPPENVLTDGQVLTLDSLLAIYDGNPYKFENDISVFATVTMDEVDGNIYKNIFIQEGESAINMRLQSSGDLFVGDYIRINLNGTVLSKFSGVMQLDSVDFAKNIAVQESNKPLTSSIVTITDLNSSFINLLASEPADPNMLWNYGSSLVKLENVQFTAAAIGGTYADGPGQQSLNIILEDCSGNQILVRTSGYSNFANELIAEGNGNLTAIVSRYNDEMQIYIRSFSEIDMTGERCAGQILLKDFEDNDILSGDWSVAQVTGADTWEIGSFSSNVLVISNYDGTNNNACESWFISPSLDLSNSNGGASMSFDNDVNYSGDQLQLLVSSDFSGTGNPNNANWIDLTGIVTWDPDTGGWGFSSTGEIDFLSLIPNGTNLDNIHIAFKYIATNFDGSTWELDNISING